MSPAAGSTLITSAPRSPRIMVQNGPARARVRSSTRTPASGRAGDVMGIPFKRSLALGLDRVYIAYNVYATVVQFRSPDAQTQHPHDHGGPAVRTGPPVPRQCGRKGPAPASARGAIRRVRQRVLQFPALRAGPLLAAG